MSHLEYHEPVLLHESVDGLNIKPDGVYVDVTFGGGGHSREILSRLGDKGHLFGFDQDKDAHKNAIDDPRFDLIPQNFRHIKRFIRFMGHKQVDGILGDFGVSSHQFNEGNRGFSIRFDGALDMRMATDQPLSAHQVINNYSEADLAKIFWEYGELKASYKIARQIIQSRSEKPINTCFELIEIVSGCLDKRRENKMLAQIFQAIRVEVNEELEVIKELLLQSKDILKPKGRLSLISYHSLEDRLVKRFIRNGLFKGEAPKDLFGVADVPFKKVGKLIVPTPEQIKENSRARSAKLRIAEKL